MRNHVHLLLGFLVALAACGGPGADRVVVLAASSLTDVAAALGEESGRPVDISAAGSHVLVQQVRSGAPGEVLLLADEDLARALATDGLAGPPVTVATTSLAIAVRADRSEAVRGPVDLARPELRVVLGDERVPLGRHTRNGLRAAERAGELPAGTTEEILAGADSFEDAARSVLSKVTTGEADAAVVFAADERLAPDLVFLPWPVEVEVRYTAQVLAGSSKPEVADAFLAFLTSEAATATWERYGFTRP